MYIYALLARFFAAFQFAIVYFFLSKKNLERERSDKNNRPKACGMFAYSTQIHRTLAFWASWYVCKYTLAKYTFVKILSEQFAFD